MTHNETVPSPPAAPVRAPDASMSLLNEVVRGSSDGYAEAAARRSGGHAPSRPLQALVLVLMLLVGFGSATALVAARETVPEAQRTVAKLRTEVDRRTRSTDAQAATLAGLTAEVAAAQASAGGPPGLGTLEQLVGAASTTGPGIVVTVDDAPARPVTGGAAPGATEPAPVDDGRVRDRELQAIVNALWASGAEAVSINGQRLTPQAAIRSAGDAILVDYRPLSPPYRVSAVGPPDRLQTDFAASSVARQFRTYASVLGIGFSVEAEPSLTLPAGAGIGLRRAVPLEGPSS